MMRKEGPKFSKENYTLCYGRMKLYLRSLGEHYWNHVIIEYIEPSGTLTRNQIKKRQDNTVAMDLIVSTLCDNEFSEEGENIEQYSKRIKDVVKSIKSARGKLEEEDVVSKILRTLLPQYAIRVSSIQELRSLGTVYVSLDSLIDEESRGSDGDGIAFVVVKEDSIEEGDMALISSTNRCGEWVIDSGCTYHMTDDRNKFLSMEDCDGGSVRFRNDAPCVVKVFGRRCYIKRDEYTGKFYPKSDKGTFLGYSTKSKAYWCLNKRIDKILESANVRVDEYSEKNEQDIKSEPQDYKGFEYDVPVELAEEDHVEVTNEEACEVEPAQPVEEGPISEPLFG
ncbi:hypothetical protein SUGI_0899930 [Cryptomeria japonica]|nr:hypothetical protein SUGI_0899930 [Cryptomeria japonica]